MITEDPNQATRAGRGNYKSSSRRGAKQIPNQEAEVMAFGPSSHPPYSEETHVKKNVRFSQQTTEMANNNRLLFRPPTPMQIIQKDEVFPTIEPIEGQTPFDMQMSNFVSRSNSINFYDSPYAVTGSREQSPTRTSQVKKQANVWEEMPPIVDESKIIGRSMSEVFRSMSPNQSPQGSRQQSGYNSRQQSPSVLERNINQTLIKRDKKKKAKKLIKYFLYGLLLFIIGIIIGVFVF